MAFLPPTAPKPRFRARDLHALLRKPLTQLIILPTVQTKVSFDRSVLLIHCGYEPLSYAERNITGAAHTHYLRQLTDHFKHGVHLNT